MGVLGDSCMGLLHVSKYTINVIYSMLCTLIAAVQCYYNNYCVHILHCLHVHGTQYCNNYYVTHIMTVDINFIITIIGTCTCIIILENSHYDKNQCPVIPSLLHASTD